MRRPRRTELKVFVGLFFRGIEVLFDLGGWGRGFAFLLLACDMYV